MKKKNFLTLVECVLLIIGTMVVSAQDTEPSVGKQPETVAGDASEFHNIDKMHRPKDKRWGRPGVPGRPGPAGDIRNPRMEIQHCLEELKAEAPERFEALMKLRQENREAFMKEVQALVKEKRKSNPHQQIMELNKQCWELGSQYRTALTEAEKEAIVAKIKENANKMMEIQIANFHKRIDDLNAQLDKLEENRNEILEKQMEFFLKKMVQL